MRPHKLLRLDSFAADLQRLRADNKVLDAPVLSEINDYALGLDKRIELPNATWNQFEAFWPPRYVKALIDGEAIVFFGSGISLTCGIPTWARLLTEHLGLDKSIAEDEDVNTDPLTMAELASQHLGSEKLQDVLRRIINRPQQYSVNHLLLCAIRCPVYITTNYDGLFERAWKDINPAIDLVIVTNDADLATTAYKEAKAGGGTILFKIHGSSSNLDEHMILTRKDYRFHYRVNRPMFDEVLEVMETQHTLFLGFGHKDPEISRLVDDAIHDYEKPKSKGKKRARPQFYSLQFDMKTHTTEVYAARGIVALRPPAVATEFEDVKTKALAVSLVDLLAAKQRNLHDKESLDPLLQRAIGAVSTPLSNALNTLSAETPACINNLAGSQHRELLQDLCDSLGQLASQGVYLLDEQGSVHDFAVPGQLDKTKRRFDKPLNHRPYFQQAKLFREPFVSNSAPSLLNGQSTFFLCVPVIEREQMVGLLFAACQIGQWAEPLKVAQEIWKDERSFLIVDANGICLVPPLNEFPTQEAPITIPGEPVDANLGFAFERLHGLSRRDRLVVIIHTPMQQQAKRAPANRLARQR